MSRRTAALINDTSGERHIGSVEVIQNIKMLCRRCNIKLMHKITRQEIMNSAKLIQQRLESVDLVIVNGEGTLHRGTVFLQNVLDLIPKKKKAVLINSIWDKMFLGNDKLLEKFEFITVREGMSFFSLKRIYPHQRIHFVPDIIFALKQKFDTSIGYGDSVLSSLKVAASKRTNFFPMQPDGVTPDAHAYIKWLKGLDLYVTGRFHGVCLAIMAEVPFLAFPSNSHKIEGILQDMGAPDLLIGSFNEIEEKRELAKEKVPLMVEYKKTAEKKLKVLEDALKELVASIPQNGEEENGDE